MTQGEGFACDDCIRLLGAGDHWKNLRKLRLLACACARRVWEPLDQRFRWLIEKAEEQADGLCPAADWERARGLANETLRGLVETADVESTWAALGCAFDVVK